MNLRKQPTYTAKKIMLITYNDDRFGSDLATYYVIKLIGEFAGNWARVEVALWDKKTMTVAGEKEPKPLKKIIGWIKYLDDTGFPNILSRFMQ